jgi:TolA-binding protein
MAVRALSTLAVVVLAALLLYSPPQLPSCSIVVTAVFSRAQDFSLEDAAKGQWEVLQPGFRRRSLILAYRYLSGLRLGDAEQKALAASAPGMPAPWPDPQVWLDARAKAPNATPASSINAYRSLGESYRYYANCLGDAFKTAAITLRARQAQFGIDSPAVAEWVRAQDLVFQNCSADRPAVIPQAAAPNLPPLIRADRAYQIAAAHFYAAHFEAAEQAFREIARDQTSPWHTIAPFLAARCMVRRATVGVASPYPSQLASAEAEIQKILNDTSMREIHASARRLLAYVLIRLHPEERLIALSRALLQPWPNEDLAQSLTDYCYLVGRSDFAERDDLTDWLLTFQGRGASSRDHAYQRWQATSSLPWLVAAIATLPSSDAGAADLLSAAAKVKPDSPAYPTVAFHSTRLLADSGRDDQARDTLDALLSKNRAPLTASARNLFLAERMKLARDLDEFLRDAPRVSVGMAYDGDLEPPGPKFVPLPFFDADSAFILTEKLPLSMLAEAATSPRLPLRLRREVALASWTRAILLEEHATATALAPTLVALEPLLKSDFSRYLAANNPEDRRFAAAFAMLRNPGLGPAVRPNLLRAVSVDSRGDFPTDNWWCKLGQSPEAPMEYNPPLQLVYPKRRIESVAFLDEAGRQQAAKEWDRLSSLLPAANYLGGEAIAYARAHPDDPRVPEALYRVVRATRYGCTDDDTGKVSKEAFDLLHERYPKSPWTEKTPYWFR